MQLLHTKCHLNHHQSSIVDALFQAGIKGMDALAEVAAQEIPEVNIDKFIVSGASKVRSK